MYIEITKDSQFMRPVILIKKENAELLTNSSICLVKGETGSGKSRLAMNFMVGLSGNPDDLDFEYQPCPEGRCVVYISTEMSRYHLQRRYLKVLDQCPPSYEDKLKFFDICGSSNKLSDLKEIARNTNPYVIIIDQLGDFVDNINDIDQCVSLIKELMNGIEKYDCAIIGVLHQNEDSGLHTKARGHIGSLLEQKVVSSIAIADRRDYFAIETTKLREGKPLGMKAIFNESTEMLTLKQNINLIEQIEFPCTASELDKQIMELINRSENTAKKVRQNWEKEKKITSTREGKEIIYSRPTTAPANFIYGV
jgi:KaiC/GvpD/RAD55 family RecA-like ATPase